MTSKRSVGSRGRGGDDDNSIDPRGNDDNDTTISLARATATRVGGNEEGDGGKSDGDDEGLTATIATAKIGPGFESPKPGYNFF